MNTKSGFYWPGYLIYALILTLFLLYFRFPTAKVEGYLAGRIAAALPGVTIVSGDYHYTYPATIIFDRVAVTRKKSGDEIVLLENVSISPVVSGLGLKYSINGGVYGGTFRFGLQLAPISGKFTLENIEIDNLDLSRSIIFQSVLQREITGSLTFRGNSAGLLEGMGGSSLQGAVTVGGGGFSLRQPILLLKQVKIEELNFTITYADDILIVEKGSLTGPELRVDFYGDLQTKGTLETWPIKLTGALQPQKNYAGSNPQVERMVKRLERQYRKDDFPYMVSGFINNPRFRFGSE